MVWISVHAHVGHPEAARGGGDASRAVDRLQQVRLPGAERDLPPAQDPESRLQADPDC
jgi:hypothetical protein